MPHKQTRPVFALAKQAATRGEPSRTIAIETQGGSYGRGTSGAN